MTPRRGPRGPYKTAKTLEQRFLEKVNMLGESDCWNWEGACYSNGYGQIAIALGAKCKRKNLLAHRVSYTLYCGEIPDGMVICHTCDNPRCVNPNHLFLGTQQENLADMTSKGRRKYPVDFGGSNRILNEDSVLEILLSGDTSASLSRKYGVTDAAIRAVRNGITWGWFRPDIKRGLHAKTI